jgi:hypothetical protein
MLQRSKRTDVSFAGAWDAEVSYSDQKADAVDVEARKQRLVQECEDDRRRNGIFDMDKRIVEAHRSGGYVDQSMLYVHYVVVAACERPSRLLDVK